MATFTKDLTGQNTAIVRDMFVEDDTYVSGEFMMLGKVDGTNLGTLASVDICDASTYLPLGFAGVCNEAITTAGDIDSYDLDTAKVIINPFAVWLAEYDQSAGIDAAGAGPTFTCTSEKGHPNMGGCWLYRMVDPGAGELDLVEDSTVSSTTCTVVCANTSTTAFTSSSDFIIIARQGQYAVALNSTTIDADALDAGHATAGLVYGFAANIQDNYVTTDAYTMRPLRCSADDTKEGRHTFQMVGAVGLDTALNGGDAKFYAAICLVRSSMYVLDSGI